MRWVKKENEEVSSIGALSVPIRVVNQREDKAVLLKNIGKNIVLLFLLTSLTGCVYMIIGGIGALGGYVVSPDTVEGITNNETATVWDAASHVIPIMGTISEQQEEGGIIMARVNGAKVTVTISSITQSSTKVTVKARKAFLPKITIAQDVFVKIMTHLSE